MVTRYDQITQEVRQQINDYFKVSAKTVLVRTTPPGPPISNNITLKHILFDSCSPPKDLPKQLHAPASILAESDEKQ